MKYPSQEFPLHARYGGMPLIGTSQYGVSLAECVPLKKRDKPHALYGEAKDKQWTSPLQEPGQARGMHSLAKDAVIAMSFMPSKLGAKNTRLSPGGQVEWVDLRAQKN